MARQIVTIDGLHGTGKSTLAHALRSRFDCNVLDVGPLFRLTAWLVDSNYATDTALACEVLSEQLRNGSIIVRLDVSCKLAASKIEIGGHSLEFELWHPRLNQRIKQAASSPVVIWKIREIAQQLVGIEPAIIVGREIGTRFFPQASVKIVLRTIDSVRSNRKNLQMAQCGLNMYTDCHIGQPEPVVGSEHTEEAFFIDTSELSHEEVAECASSYIVRKLGWVDRKNILEPTMA